MARRHTRCETAEVTAREIEKTILCNELFSLKKEHFMVYSKQKTYSSPYIETGKFPLLQPDDLCRNRLTKHTVIDNETSLFTMYVDWDVRLIDGLDKLTD